MKGVPAMPKTMPTRPMNGALALLLALVLVPVVGRSLAAQDMKAIGLTRSLVIEIRNPGPVDLIDHPVTLDVAKLRAAAPDFNSYNFGLFEVNNGQYHLIQSQADDLDKDRYHDEIFFLKTLPARSTVRLICYYSPKGSMKIIIKPRVAVRPGSGDRKDTVTWESFMNAWKFDSGRLVPYGKFTKSLILQQLRIDDGRPQGWGMRLLSADATAGIGGLRLFDGSTAAALYGDGPVADPFEAPVVISMGPIRTLVRIDSKPIKHGAGTIVVSCLYSQAADTAYTRVDVTVRGNAAGPVVLGPAVRKFDGETTAVDRQAGVFASWGKGASGTGESGAAVIFKPADFAGLAEFDKERAVKLTVPQAKALTYWLLSAWSRGTNAPQHPAAKNWSQTAAALAAGLNLPLEITITPEK